MKDLYESLHEAHKLDEATSSDWFSDMKRWLQETNADEEKFFWSDHHDYVDEVYSQAVEKVSEEYNHLNIGFEFSTQAGRGMCEVFGNDDEGSGYYRWDFEEDREDVFEIVNESESVEELLRALVDYLSGKVECINWEDNSEDDYDDYEDEDEYDDDFEKLFLDEATSEKETTKTTDEIKHEITSSIWEIVHEHAYPNGCSDTDAFYSALRELSKKYSDHRRLFYNIRSRILNKEVWYD